MEYIKKSIGILILALSMFSCDAESNFQKSNIELVPVYSLTDISGGNSPFAINIYKTLPLIIEYSSEVTAKKFSSASFSDSSTGSMYIFNLAKIIEIFDDEGIKTGEEIVGYWLEADKTTGEGTLTVVTDVTEVLTIKIAEIEVYN